MCSGGLSSLRVLWLYENELAELPAGVFGGLSSLRFLNLSENGLAELPAGVFGGLTSLESLKLQGNPGSPFSLAIRLERTDSDDLQAPGPATFSARLAEGTPLDLVIRLAARGGTLSADTVKMEAGDTATSEVSVSGTGSVAVSLTAPEVPATKCGSYNPVPCYQGFKFVAADSLVLFGERSSGMSDRTLQVKDAVMLGADRVSRAGVTSKELAGITQLDRGPGGAATVALMQVACRENGKKFGVFAEEMLGECGPGNASFHHHILPLSKAGRDVPRGKVLTNKHPCQPIYRSKNKIAMRSNS